MSSNAYMREYMKRRYHERRNRAIEALGGICQHPGCGSTENLQFDHIDPEAKVVDIWSTGGLSKEKLAAELTKCQLLCKLHHTQKTMADRGQQSARETHGSLSSYRYCKCHLCRAAKSAHNKEYRRLKGA